MSDQEFKFMLEPDDDIEVKEAKIIPPQQSLKRAVIDIAVRNILNGNAKKVVNETSKHAEQVKDSVNSSIYGSIIYPENLISGTITNHLRKFNK